MKAKIFLALILWGQSAFSEERKPDSLSLPLRLSLRLSWAPYEFLSQGYRNAPWINDPFFPQGTRFRLTGLISEEMAFINGKWFRLGEKINGFTVKSISGKGVTLARQGEIILLTILEP